MVKTCKNCGAFKKIGCPIVENHCAVFIKSYRSQHGVVVPFVLRCNQWIGGSKCRQKR